MCRLFIALALFMTVTPSPTYAESDEGKTYSITYEDMKQGNRWDLDETWELTQGGFPGDGAPSSIDHALLSYTHSYRFKLNGKPREITDLTVEVTGGNSLSVGTDQVGNTLTVHGDFSLSGGGTFTMDGYYGGTLAIHGEASLMEGLLLVQDSQWCNGTLQFRNTVTLDGGKIQSNHVILGPGSSLSGTLDHLANGVTLSRYENEERTLKIARGVSLDINGLGDLKPAAGTEIVLITGFSKLSGQFDGLRHQDTFSVKGRRFQIEYRPESIVLIAQ